MIPWLLKQHNGHSINHAVTILPFIAWDHLHPLLQLFLLILQRPIGWFKDLQLDLQLEPQLNPNSNFNLTKFDRVGVQVGVRCLNAFHLRIIRASTHTSISPVVYHTIILNCTSKFLFPFMPTISKHQLFIQVKQEDVSGVVLPVFKVECVYTL